MTFEGIGPVKIGSTLSDLESLGFWLTPQDHVPEGSLPTVECSNTTFFSRGTMLGALVAAGHVRRIDVLGPGISTVDGIHVNSTEADAYRIYGNRLSRFPRNPQRQMGANGAFGGNPGHPYDPHYMVVHSLDRQSILLMETDGTDIVAIHIGPAEVFWSSKDNPVFIPDCWSVIENHGWVHAPVPN
jgi:hypothetical protein